MGEEGKISRRSLLGAGLALGALDTACLKSNEQTLGGPGPTLGPALGPAPLAQDFVIAARVPADGKYYYMHDPGMTMRPGGSILVAAPCLGQSTTGAATDGSVRTFISRSSDRGRTWETVATLPYSDATPFVQDGRLYMFVQRAKWEDVSIVTSGDEGRSWTEPVTLFKGVYWNCDTGMAFERGRLHFALQTDDKGYVASGLVVIAGDPKADLMTPGAWKMSARLPHPTTPPALSAAGTPRPEWWGWYDTVKKANADAWLEPNTISVNGKIRVLLRTVIDGYGTAGMCAVCDLDDAGNVLAFSQFYPVPGSQNKFFILKDPASRLFWMVANLPADARGAIFDWDAIRDGGRFLNGPGNDRRFLMLFYGVDGLSWFPAGCVARATDPHHSFMYPSADIDGDDIVLISRTSLNAVNQHDADVVTFHRIRNFRSLAMNLFPA